MRKTFRVFVRVSSLTEAGKPDDSIDELWCSSLAGNLVDDLSDCLKPGSGAEENPVIDVLTAREEPAGGVDKSCVSSISETFDCVEENPVETSHSSDREAEGGVTADLAQTAEEDFSLGSTVEVQLESVLFAFAPTNTHQSSGQDEEKHSSAVSLPVTGPSCSAANQSSANDDALVASDTCTLAHSSASVFLRSVNGQLRLVPLTITWKNC